MASFLRGRQAGIADLSAGITPDLFAPDDQARFGINSQTSCVAYDPVQSLLAVGTAETRFGPGRIYVFGQQRVHRVLDPPRPTSVVSLRFSANRLVCLDSRSEISVWDLATGERRAANTIAGGVACETVDPLLDWAFLGLKTGEVVAYDLDRERLAATFKLPNFWAAREAAGARVGVVSLALHPRDIGQLLIGYTHGAVVYSIKLNKPTKYFEYALPAGAPGGDGEISAIVRRPALTHAVWHPTGTFVLTAHEDGSLVFWDPREEKMVMARTVADLNVDRPAAAARPHKTGRIVDVAWCCKQNPDDTALLVAGGQPEDAAAAAADGPALTFLELGPTPIYATSSWQALEAHFHDKRTMRLALPAPPTGFTLLPRTSPYFAGGQDPIAIVVNLGGELITLSFPSGYPISPTNQLHPSVSLVHPYVTRFAVAAVPREKWLGFAEKRSQGEPLLRGGAPGPKPRRRFEDRTILQLAHGDGTVRSRVSPRVALCRQWPAMLPWQDAVQRSQGHNFQLLVTSLLDDGTGALVGVLFQRRS
jgi:syntaxin-binding protein 5